MDFRTTFDVLSNEIVNIEMKKISATWLVGALMDSLLNITSVFSNVMTRKTKLRNDRLVTLQETNLGHGNKKFMEKTINNSLK